MSFISEALFFIEEQLHFVHPDSATKNRDSNLTAVVSKRAVHTLVIYKDILLATHGLTPA